MLQFPDILPEMTAAQTKALRAHRRRLTQRGLLRLEVRVPKDDAWMVKQLATALADPLRHDDTREKFLDWLSETGVGGVHALLLNAPLEGVPLKRARDRGRAIKL
jgi:hypothetical protein